MLFDTLLPATGPSGSANVVSTTTPANLEKSTSFLAVDAQASMSSRLRVPFR